MPAARIGDQTRKKRENGVTRDVVFKMERPGLVEVGQTVEVTESVTPFNVNYMIEPADHGVVKAIEENDRGYYVTVTFEYE